MRLCRGVCIVQWIEVCRGRVAVAGLRHNSVTQPRMICVSQTSRVAFGGIHGVWRGDGLLRQVAPIGRVQLNMSVRLWNGKILLRLGHLSPLVEGGRRRLRFGSRRARLMLIRVRGLISGRFAVGMTPGCCFVAGDATAFLDLSVIVTGVTVVCDGTGVSRRCLGFYSPG